MNKDKEHNSSKIKPEEPKENKDTLGSSPLKETTKETKEEEVVEIVKEEKPKEEIKKTTEVAIIKEDKKELPSKAELVKLTVDNTIKDTPINNLNTPTEIAIFSEMLVGAKMCPYKTPADAMIAIIAGKELGLSLAATLGGIHPIEGRPSLGVHIKKGILLQHNVLFKRTRDLEQYYEFVEMVENKPVVVKYGYLDEQPDNTKKKHIDTRTEYLFTRYFNTYKGVIKNTAIGMFSLAEAKNADLLKKDNWKKYLRDMMASRAFSRGSNEIADDLLHGMYSYSELADLNDSVTYYIDEKGHEQIMQ